MYKHSFIFIIIFNILNLSSVSAVTGDKISLSTPLTEEEVLAGVLSNSFSLSTVSGISHVKVSILVTRLESLSSALFPLVHSNPLRISLPDLSVCASSGCGFTVVTAYVDNSTFFNGTYEGGIETIETPCVLGSSSRSSHTCSNGLNVTAVCQGGSNVSVTTICPKKIKRPSCGRLTSSSVVDDVCTLSSYTPTQTTCACTVPVSTLTNGSRRLTGIEGMLHVYKYCMHVHVPYLPDLPLPSNLYPLSLSSTPQLKPLLHPCI